jgi:N-acetyl-gamma-glutamyl-phosphate reductase
MRTTEPLDWLKVDKGLAGENRQMAVVGVSGYAGQELARLLLRHPRLNGLPPVFCGRKQDSLTTVHPALRGMAPNAALAVEPFTWELLKNRGVGTVFLAAPHEQSRVWAPQALALGLRVIDLSGAWRLKDAGHRAVYGFADNDAPEADAVQTLAVYGMPELHHDAIVKARLIANPGCYATSVILALKPLVAAGLVDLDHGVICDAKSGVSGAGKEPTAKTHFMYAANNLSTYGLWKHRHTGELYEQLGVDAEQIVFTPHLLPIPRGILSTIYMRFKERMTQEAVEQCFAEFYEGRPMVRLFKAPELPQIASVERTNFCDIGVSVASDGRRGIVVSCLDNLLKGAASQAVQNWNLMCGWDEAEGLL